MKRTSVLLMGFFFLEGWSAPDIITEGCTVMTMCGEHNGSNPRGGVLLRSFPSETDACPPCTVRMLQNSPHTCNPIPIVNFQISLWGLAFSKFGLVSVKVYDMPGSEATALVDAVEQAGEHTVSRDAADLSTGIYFYRLETVSVSDPAMASVQIRKMIYMK